MGRWMCWLETNKLGLGGQKREMTGNDYFPVEKGIAIPLAQWFPIEQVI